MQYTKAGTISTTTITTTTNPFSAATILMLRYALPSALCYKLHKLRISAVPSGQLNGILGLSVVDLFRYAVDSHLLCTVERLLI